MDADTTTVSCIWRMRLISDPRFFGYGVHDYDMPRAACAAAKRQEILLSEQDPWPIITITTKGVRATYEWCCHISGRVENVWHGEGR